MRRAPRSLASILAILALGLVSCAPAATQPTAAPAAPKATAAPAAAKDAAKPAAQPTQASAKTEAKAESKTAAKPSGEPVKIGYILPLSGPVAVYGAGVKHAPTLILEEVNASGGINGSPLEVVVIDSPNNPNQTVTGMRRLANEDRVFGIVGPYYTGEMQAAVPLLKDLKVPTVAYTPAAAHPGVVETNEWAFLADSSETRTVSIAVDGFKKVHPNVKKIAVVGDTQTSVTAITIKDAWPTVLPEKGYEIVDTITFQFNTADFSPIATRIKASGAEAIALSALSPAGPNLLKELERQGAKLPVVSSSHLQTVPPLPQILGATADGLVQTMFFSPDDLEKPSVRQWVERYEAAAAADNPSGEKVPVGYANEVQAYDAFQALVRGLRDAGVKADTPLAEAREKTRQAMMQIKDLPGVLKQKEITAEGRITWDFHPLVARGGKYETID